MAMEQESKDPAPRNLAIWIIVILFLAMAARFMLARYAYPAPDDGAHFVAYGIALAHGDPAGLSTFWSQGMILVSAGFAKMGFFPAKPVQFFSAACGIIVVLALMLLTRVWVGRWKPALLVGALAACNPTLIQYSASDYSEMPFMAFALGSAVCFSDVILKGRGRTLLVVGGILLGISAYFKGLDACIWAFVLFAFWGVRLLIRGRDWMAWGRLLLGVLLFAITIYPLCAFTYSRTGQFAPGSKSGNFALGDDWRDSKKAYAVTKSWSERQVYLKERGTLAFFWKYRNWVFKRWVQNCVESFRIYTDMIFRGPFRLGPGWMAILILVGGAGLLLKRKLPWRSLSLPFLLFAVPTVLIATCYVPERLLVPSLAPLLIVLGAVIWALLEPLFERKTLAWLTALALAYFVVGNARLGVRAGPPASVPWRFPNMIAVGEELRKIGTDDDILMVSGPHIPLHFYRTNLLNYVELPAATIGETEQQAARKKATLIVVSDQWRAHWPINSIFHGASVPTNWMEVARFNYPGDPDRAIPDEQYIVFRRSPAEAVNP